MGQCSRSPSSWLPGLALSGITFAVTTLAWLRLRLGLDTDSVRYRRQAVRHVYRRRRRERQGERSAHKAGGRSAGKVKRRKLTGEPA